MNTTANDEAIDIILANNNAINWNILRTNNVPMNNIIPNEWLIQIDWSVLSGNRSTRAPIVWTVYDYDHMSARRGRLHAEIMREIYHPRRIQQWVKAGNDVKDYRRDLIEDNIF